LRLDFDSRLDRDTAQPLAVAVSGGGDSILLLTLAATWAKGAGRPLIALSVDHGLQPQSAAWTTFVGEVAEQLGCAFRPLPWEGEKPVTGLAAAARSARHRLLAEAARAAGARVILTGHTADDQWENAVLGQGALADWSPSPVWPEGRGLFLFRPMLGLRRGEVRRALAAHGARWIDDPANDDPRHPRVRVRLAAPATLAAAPVSALRPGTQVWRMADGVFSGERRAVEARALAAALTCVSGRERPASAIGVQRLVERIARGELFTATLAGCKITAGDRVIIARDAGERARGGLALVHLETGRPVVWDGRYELTALQGGLTVQAAAGQAASLDAADRDRLLALPVAARGAAPIVRLKGVETPTLAERAPVALRWLAPARFLAACGAMAHETALTVAEPAVSPYVPALPAFESQT